MAGNLSGARRYYAYTSDSGVEYKYLTDEDLGTAIGATLNDTNPDFPRRFSPRRIHCRDDDGNKKSIIAPTTTNTAYAADASTTITIDTVDFSTTGRTGEKMTFGSNPT